MDKGIEPDSEPSHVTDEKSHDRARINGCDGVTSKLARNSRGDFCAVHRSHFCPCAAPWLYRDDPTAAAPWEAA
jgi:hypothetical protein